MMNMVQKRPPRGARIRKAQDSNPGRSAIGKSKKKSIVEVVILSPKKKGKQTEASGDNSKTSERH
jgi:hypothetical protein